MSAHAQVATGTTGIDNSGNYRQEVQACMSGRTQQDQATCLREARNARADRKPGKTASSTDYRANAALRCNGLSGEGKAACEARVMGYGAESGSVAGGGVLTSVETVVTPAGAELGPDRAPDGPADRAGAGGSQLGPSPGRPDPGARPGWGCRSVAEPELQDACAPTVPVPAGRPDHSQ